MNQRLGRKIFSAEKIKYTGLWSRANWWHCSPNGGPVLKTEVSWRTVSGFYVRIGHRLLSVQWRRFWGF
jgi:hypothetical protein